MRALVVLADHPGREAARMRAGIPEGTGHTIDVEGMRDHADLCDEIAAGLLGDSGQRLMEAVRRKRARVAETEEG